MAGLVKTDTVDPQTAGVGIALKGRTSGSSWATGYVGEILESNVSSPATANSGAGSAYADVTSLSLTAGTWLITGVVTLFRNGATASAAYAGGGFGTTSGNNGPNVSVLSLNDLGTNAAIASTWSQMTATPQPTFYNISATTTVYLKILSTGVSAGNTTMTGKITAIRIA